MMHRILSLCCVLLMLLVGQVALAGKQEPIGARPAGMGGAFVGVADDGNALYWNSAGMSFLDHHEITMMYADLFGLDIINNYVAYTYPLTDRAALGIDWFNIGHNDDELDFSFNKFNFGASYRFHRKFAAGVLLKYLSTNTDFDGETIGKGNGWSADMGLLYKYSPSLSIGFAMYNFSNAEITYDNGVKSTYYEREARVGVGYKPIEELLLAADIGDRAHVGLEYTYSGILPLRAGLERDLKKGEKETALSFGLGVRYSPFQFDYAYTSHEYLDQTSKLSLSLFFNFGRSVVSVKNARILEQQGLFPSRWKNYAQVPFLAFDVQNRSDKPVRCEWEVNIKDKMDAPTRGEVALRPKEERTVFVTAAFSENFYGNEQDLFTSGEINVRYQQNRQMKREKNEFQAFIYGKNAIDWEENVAWVASFINPQDRLIRTTASSILDHHRELIDPQSAAANLQYAMVIFDELKDMGIHYLPDPNTPYGLLEERETYIDDVQFPAELLTSRAGDCDDLTALMCALLESIGVETVVLDVPGHLFFMFDIGVMPIYGMTVMVEDNLLVDYGGRLYVPVEVTEIQSGFLQAWREGAAQYVRWQDLGELHQIPLHQAWTAYPPVPLALPAEGRAEVLAVSSTAQAEIKQFEQMQQTYLSNTYLERIRTIRSVPDSLNAVALEYIFAGKITEAERVLREALTHDSLHLGVLNNLAGVLSLQNRTDESEQLFERLFARTGPVPEEVACNWILTECLTLPSATPDARTSVLSDIENGLNRLGLGDQLRAELDQVQVCLKDSSLPAENLIECVSLALRRQEPPETSHTRLQEKGQSNQGKVGWILWYGVDFD